MATKTKAKPVAKKAPVKKAAPAAAKASKAPANVLEDNVFAKFTGYKGETPADEAVFTEGEIVYIIGHEDTETGVVYTAIAADEVAAFMDGGEDVIERGGELAGGEVSELKGGALEKAREAHMPIVLVGRMSELLEASDGDAILTAVELNQSIQESYFYMGGALAEILKSGSYLVENGGEYEGEEAFNDFCQGEFGFKASKGRQLARIYSTFSAMPNFDPQSLAAIGWSIAGKIEKYVTPENVDQVIEAASGEGVTQRNVDTLMKEQFVSANGLSDSGRATSRGGDKLVLKTLQYRLSEDSAETVEIAIQQFMKQRGIQDPALALEGICVEWGQEHIETKTAKMKLNSKANAAAKKRAAAPEAKTKAPATTAAKPKPTRKKAA